MAAAEPACGQPGSPGRAVGLEGLDGVGRAAGHESTRRRRVGPRPLVQPDRADQRRGGRETGAAELADATVDGVVEFSEASRLVTSRSSRSTSARSVAVCSPLCQRRHVDRPQRRDERPRDTHRRGARPNVPAGPTRPGADAGGGCERPPGRPASRWRTQLHALRSGSIECHDREPTGSPGMSIGAETAEDRTIADPADPAPLIVMQRVDGDPCAAGTGRWPGRRGRTCGDGSRACVHDGASSADRCASLGLHLLGASTGIEPGQTSR